MFQINAIVASFFFSCIFECDTFDSSRHTNIIRSINLLAETVIIIVVTGQILAIGCSFIANFHSLYSRRHERADRTPLTYAIDTPAISSYTGIIGGFSGEPAECFQWSTTHRHLGISA